MDDLEIKVPVNPILSQLECPICLDNFKDCCITPCGHLYCSSCLADCLNLNHHCPNCKKDCESAQVARNYHVDTLITHLKIEKERASKEYYDLLVHRAIAREDSVARNPIETVFQQNMKHSLFAFENHYEQLVAKHERMKNRARDTGTQEKLNEMDLQFHSSVQFLVQAYDTHMKLLAPAPELLPVRIFVKVPAKNLTIDRQLPRTCTLKDLEILIIEHFAARNDPVENFGPGRFLLYPPVIADDSDIVVLEDFTVPLAHLAVQQGASFIYDGVVTVKSDAPKVCFTFDYEKGKGQSTNYYSCKDCGGMNWVCEPCSQSCHLGHDIRIAIQDHTPTWACCYCVKRGVCKIPNSRSRDR